jgi:glutamate dehydrogenase
VLERTKQHGDTAAAVRDLTAAMGLTGGRPHPADLEGAMLEVWALSEGSNPERLAVA